MNGHEMETIKNLFQETNGLVIQLSRDINYMRGEMSQMNERITTIESRMTMLEQQMSAVETRVNSRINEVESRLSKEIRENFKWMIGMMIPVWIGVLVAVLAQFIKP